MITVNETKDKMHPPYSCCADENAVHYNAFSRECSVWVNPTKRLKSNSNKSLWFLLLSDSIVCTECTARDRLGSPRRATGGRFPNESTPLERISESIRRPPNSENEILKSCDLSLMITDDSSSDLNDILDLSMRLSNTKAGLASDYIYSNDLLHFNKLLVIKKKTWYFQNDLHTHSPSSTHPFIHPSIYSN